jgi:hypothetical protein
MNSGAGGEASRRQKQARLPDPPLYQTGMNTRRLSIKLSSVPWRILAIDLLLARREELQPRPLD